MRKFAVYQNKAIEMGDKKAQAGYGISSDVRYRSFKINEYTDLIYGIQEKV